VEHHAIKPSFRVWLGENITRPSIFMRHDISPPVKGMNYGNLDQITWAWFSD
jgi:hypothetical protein